MKKSFFTLLFLGTLFQIYSQATVTLIPSSSNWKFLDDGSNQGAAWYGTGFNDGSWASGNAELGYGDGDETTIVSYGPNPSLKYPTTYFRKTINVPIVGTYTSYTTNFRRDDGIILYINGVEVLRNNMPLSGVNYTTYASTNCADDGNTIITATFPASVITTGTNVIAAEIHQTNGSSSDLTFILELIANTNLPPLPTIVKGPYMQIGTQNSMMIRWETNTATDSQVAFGTNSLALTNTVTNAAVVTSHSIQINGLTPYTKYYYNVGSTTYVIQGDQNNYFLTSPVPGTAGDYRFWMVGDCGNASSNQINVKNQFVTWNGSRNVDGWLLSGDNAYSSGTNAEFNAEFFNIYQTDVMKKMVLWPAPGNHDYNNGASTATTVPYYSFFSTPTSAQAGGVASGNPAYYSYDYGNIHFISLDSYGTVAGNKMYDTLGAQAVWLKADLAANTKRWTIAYWHHPPYTMGSHNSDSESDLAAVRTNFIRILERNKVDMILVGHSHDYERSKLMKGHYGNEGTFNAGVHNLSTQSGVYDGSSNSCPYLKDSINVKNGTVYVVSGSAGQLGGTQGAFPHNAMHYSNATNGGSFIMDIKDNRLDATWLCADGVVRDKFTIYKDVDVVKTFTVLPGVSNTVSASWPGNYLWSNAAVTQSIAVNPTTTTTYWVKDVNSCVADTFKFKVLPAVNFNSSAPYCSGAAVSFSDMSTNSPTSWSWSVSPGGGVSINTPTAQNPTITFSNSGTYSVTLISSNAYGPGLAFTSTVSILASPNLTATASSTSICNGQTATLSVNGANTYTWDNGSNLTNISVSPTVNTTFTVSGTAVNGCISTNTISLIANPNPTISITPSNTMICSGQNVTLNASGANNYTWNPGGLTGASVTVSPIANQIYSITGMDLNACTNLSTSNVSVTTSPTVTANSATICSGSTATLIANGATNYTWNPGGITGATVTVSPLVNTTYSILGANGICNNLNTANVTVNALPNLTTTATSSAICNGQTATLSVNGANTYTWDNGSNLINIAVSPTVNTTFTVSGTDVNSCSSSNTISLVVNQNPTVNAVANNTSICTGQNSTLTATGATAYTWNPGGLTGNTIVVSPLINQTYSVTGLDINSCFNLATTNVSVTQTPTVAANSSTICPGGTATLIASGAANYTWNPGGVNSSTFTTAPLVNSTYSVTGANGNCTSVQTVSVTIGASVSISVNSPTICNGQTATLTANGAATYTWSNGSNGSNITVNPSSSTSYSVDGTIGNCGGTQTTMVTVNLNPTVSASSNSSLICVGQSVTLTATGGNTYLWSTGASSAVIIVSPTTTTNYSVTGTGANGCSNTSFVTQNVTDCTGISSIAAGNNNSITIYPNPNNGVFNIDVNGSDQFNIVIYNSISQLVHKGQLLPGSNLIQLKYAPGIYYYNITKDKQSINKGKIIVQ